MCNEKDTLDKATDACISYKLTSGKANKNYVDLKLLEMLDNNFKELFEKTYIPDCFLDKFKE